MDSLCTQLLRENPHILSCTIAFEPGTYPQFGIYHEVYAHRNPADSTQIEVTINGGKQLYTREKWYFIPLHHEKPIWIDPYVDVEHGETSIITSYGMPLHDKDGELVGVLSAHISMKWFADLVLSLQPFPNSHASVMGTDGHLIIHPDSTLEAHQAFFSEAFNDPTSEGHLAAISMKTGLIGHSEIKMGGKKGIIFYHPFENAGWSVAAAHRMANGHLDEPVDVSHRTDEVGYVQNEFRQMQQSISHHIADITNLTDVLRQRNEDLKLAYEQAREADRMKDAVILNMSDRMEQSVKAIHATVADFRQHVADMDANECRQMADKIQKHSEITTELLGNLLDIADRGGGDILVVARFPVLAVA